MMYLAKVLVTACAFFSLASAETFTVTVGSGYTFSPDHVANASATDIIQFNFTSSTRHSATRSTLNSPCSPGSPAIDSGAFAVPTLYSVTINDTNPLYFYCKVGNHCNMGMVFAVNVNDSTFAAFKARATGASGSVSSGSSTGTSALVSPTPSALVGGYTNGSGAKAPIQKLTAGLAGVAFLVKLFL